MRDKSTLKPCPFCGSLATYVWDDIDKAWIAGCTNKKCICHVDVIYQGFDGFTESIDHARRIWNRRAGDAE